MTAIWLLIRFGGAADAELLFVPAGTTLDGQPPDADPSIIHVDTGGGCFDHHQCADVDLSSAELIRRAIVPDDPVVQRLVRQVTQIDHADVQGARLPLYFNVNDLIAGYNALYPNHPQLVAQAMLPNLDAWYEHEARQSRLENAFGARLEFYTRWGLGIAMQSIDGASSRLAYGQGAVLYVYRDGRGYMGIAARSRSRVDLAPVYEDLKRVDGHADWYLHPSHRLLLCGTAKAPPRQVSSLSLEELVDVLRSS